MQDQSKSADVVVLKADPKGRRGNAKCPICAKPAHTDHKPFCSKRCADIDLGKWLGEGYRIPGDDLSGCDDGEDGEV